MNRPADKKPVKITHMPKSLTIKVHEATEHIAERQVKIGTFLGKGGFAECYRAHDINTQKDYALKILSKTSDGMKKELSGERLKNEILLMSQLKHENILRLLGNCEDQHNYYLLLELCNHNTLNEMLKKRESLTELEAKYFIRQIVKGILHLKQNRIIHRDIKTTNILLDDNLVIKIGDFGLAILSTEEDRIQRFSVCGTPSYMAPEVVSKKPYSYEADMWSVGVVAFNLLFGKPPFYSNDKKKIYEKIKKVEYEFDGKNKVSEDAMNFIKRIFQLDPKRRLTPEQALSESFLTENIPTHIPIECYEIRVRMTEIQRYCTNELPYLAVGCQEVNKFTKKDSKHNHSNRTLVSYFHNPNLEKHMFKDMKKEKERSHFELKIEENAKVATDEFGLFEVKIDSNKHGADGKRKQSLAEKEEHSELPLGDIKNKLTDLKKYEIVVDEENERKKECYEAKFSCHVWLNRKLKSEQYIYEFKDYTDRFGMCFMLSNGVKGIIFNDKSTIVICEDLKKIVYMERETVVKENERLMYKLVNHQSSTSLPNQSMNSTKYKIRLEKNLLEFQLPMATAEQMKKDNVRNFNVIEFKTDELPKNPNIIKKYFLLKDYCKKCSNLPNDLVMSRDELENINLINCATMIEKYGRKKSSKQYIFLTKNFIQIEFQDWSKYIIMNNTSEVFIINQEYGLHKMMNLPVSKENNLPPFMIAHFNAVSDLLGYFLNKHEKKSQGIKNNCIAAPSYF